VGKAVGDSESVLPSLSEISGPLQAVPSSVTFNVRLLSEVFLLRVAGRGRACWLVDSRAVVALGFWKWALYKGNRS